MHRRAADAPGDGPFRAKAGDPDYLGEVIGVGDGVIFIEPEGTDMLLPLPIGDWSGWAFYATHEDAGIAHSLWAMQSGLIDPANHRANVQYYEENKRARHSSPRHVEGKPRKVKRNPAREAFAASMTKARRFSLLQRDGFRCHYCRTAGELHIDHVVPLSKGGSNEDDNLVAACPDCNGGKRDRLLES